LASHLLDEVEKVCTHAAILKTGNLITTGDVAEIMMDEDVVELSAENISTLSAVLKHFGKEVLIDNTITEVVELDLNITPELKEEGNIRELIRGIQELRKQEKLNPSDVVGLKIKTDQAGATLVQKFEMEVKKVTLVKNISFENLESGNVVKVEEMTFELKISR
jgi:ABC-type multidrug transport system ATPase subunit